MTSPIDLAAIRERAEKASAAPWVAECYENIHAAHEDGEFTWCTVSDYLRDPYHGAPVGCVFHGTPDGGTTGLPGSLECSAADAEFIAHARSDIPALLDEVTRLTAALTTYGQHLHPCRRSNQFHMASDPCSCGFTQASQEAP